MIMPYRHSGFSLIELMISLTIGVLVLTAATGLVVTAADSRRIVKHSAELQEEAFFITHILKQQLSQAGYRRIGDTDPSSRALPIANLSDHYPPVTGKWLSGQLINITSGTLFYRFDGASLPGGAPDGSIYDCLGNAIPFGVVVESAISMQSNSLVCTVGVNNAQLIDGSQDTSLEQMVYILGVDSDSDGTIDRTVDAAVASTSDFTNTRNLTIRMLLATRDNVINHHQTFRFNGTETTATDHRLRTEAVVSVALRH